MLQTHRRSPRRVPNLRGSTWLSLLLTTMLLAGLAPVPAWAATPTVTAPADVNYVESDGPLAIGTGTAIAGGGFYDGQYIEFSVAGATAGETLDLQEDGSPDSTNGVVSIVSDVVYLGNGATADAIGVVDSTLDGSGTTLRVDFTSDFANAGFETGDTTGWTTLNQRVDLGVSSIASCATTDTSTYPGDVTNQDNNVPDSLGIYTSNVVTTGAPTEGTHALELASIGVNTLVGYDVVHGPVAVSSPFQASAGDNIYFDWRAFAGGDAYHVFGYIIDDSCNQTEVLDAVGSDSTGSTNWATKVTAIPSDGTYRFVFVSGTFDFSGGEAAGARLLIDNVRVFGSKVDDAAVQQVAERLTYVNTDEESAATRTVTIAARNADMNTASDSFNIDVDIDPAVATDVVATPGIGKVDLTWTAPDPGTYPITDYVVRYSTNGGSSWTTYADGTSTATTAEITGLSDGTEYLFSVAAVNSVGNAPFVNSPAVTTHDVPQVVTGLAGTAGNQKVTLDWDAPADGGSSITDYTIRYSSDGGGTWTTFADGVSTDTDGVVTGLVNGTSYVFQVLAKNLVGTGSFSATTAAVIPVTVPAAAGDVTAARGIASLSVSWSTPDNGGSAITDYLIKYSDDGGATWTTFGDGVSTNTSATITGLTDATTYRIRVAAVSAVGTGAWSPAISAATAGAPSDVTALAATAGNGMVSLEWDAPDDGGSAITDYVIEYSADGGATWTMFADGASAETGTVVTGLDNGRDYLFRVAAVNTLGTGDYATSTEPVAPSSGVAPFVDVPDTVFESDIVWLADRGITRGCNPPANTTFCPEVGVTRAEMATFLDRFVGFAATDEDFFADDNGNTHEAALNRAAAAGVFRGCNPPTRDRVCPGEVLTRGEAAAVIVRALGLHSDAPGHFTDTAGHLFGDELSIVGGLGILRGCNPPSNDQACPDDPITRGQMAAILRRSSEV